jgi:hypothetical protein
VKYPVNRESFWVVERTQKIGFRVLRQIEDVSNRVPEVRDDNGPHNGAECLMDAS